jgi:hypothetical protein
MRNTSDHSNDTSLVLLLILYYSLLKEAMLGSKRYTPDFVRLRCCFQFVLTLTNGFHPVGLEKGIWCALQGALCKRFDTFVPVVCTKLSFESSR